MLLEDAKKQEHFFQAAGGDFVFDIMRSKSMKEWIVKPGKEPVILPIAATEQAQSVRFRAEGLEEEARLGQWEYSFFRMDKETTVSSASEAPLVFGRPVPLGHSKRRRRMVLHILLDDFGMEEPERSEVSFRCDCSREKMEGVLVGLGRHEMMDLMLSQETVEVHCDYCNTYYRFSRSEMKELFKKHYRPVQNDEKHS